MDAEQVRRYLLKLPHATETMQWGANLVFWVGDKALGGKMFALINLDEDRNPLKPKPVLSFYAGPEQYPVLLEEEGVVPAPYMARIFWVSMTGWNVFRKNALEELLLTAHSGIFAKLPVRTRQVLALPASERAELLKMRKAELAGRKSSAAKRVRKSSSGRDGQLL